VQHLFQFIIHHSLATQLQLQMGSRRFGLFLFHIYLGESSLGLTLTSKVKVLSSQVRQLRVAKLSTFFLPLRSPIPFHFVAPN